MRVNRLTILVFALLWSNLITSQGFELFNLGNGVYHQYVGGIYGCGVSFADFDKDGWDDLTIPQNGANPLFIRNNAGTLQQAPTFMQSDDEIKQMTWVDYDNDGDRDLFVTGVGMPIRLLNNDGQLNFTDVSVAAGFQPTVDMTYGNSWGDYDRDGDLDVFISNYDAEYAGMTNADNKLFRNNGDGTFTDVAEEAGIYFEVNYTFMGLWFDYDKDLWPDLLITNDRYEARNYLFHNNGDGTFTDITYSAGLADFIWNMSDTGDDYDNDGDLDLYLTNGPDGNLQKRNNGDGTFSDVAAMLGTEVNQFCWSAQFVDVDNDSWQDLHVCSTPISSIAGGVVFFKNSEGTFTDHTIEAGIEADNGYSRGSAIGDINNDGFADIAVIKTSPSFSSFWRALPNENHWLKVALQGTTSNIDGVGSWIECHVGENVYTRYTYLGEAYLAQNSFAEFFGLGDIEMVDSLIVEWPSGILDTWKNIPTNQYLHLTEGASAFVELNTEDSLMACLGDTVSFNANNWQSYLWSNGSVDSSAEYDSTASVFVIVTDSAGNSFLSDTVNVAFDDLPVIEVITQNPLCYGENSGQISLQSTDDITTSTIIWDEVNFNGHVIQNLVAGDYEYTLITPFNCQTTGVVSLTQPDSIYTEITVQDLLCAGDSSGSAAMEIFGGTPNYIVDWNGVNPDQLTAGNYLVNIQDQSGCSVQRTFFVDEPELLTADLFTQNVFCNGESSGMAELTPQGGSGNYYIDWLGVDPLQLPAGYYEVELQDDNGCDSIFTFEIQQPEALTAILTITPQIENGVLGTVSIIIQGGTEPYQVAWSGGEEDVSELNGLSAGEYSVGITDNNGCFVLEEFEVVLLISVGETSKSQFEIFPNPFDQYFDVRFSGNSNFIVQIFDMAGRKIFEKSSSGDLLKIDTLEICEGNYKLVVNNNGQIQSFNIHKK